MALTQLTADVSVISKLDNYPPDDAGMTPAKLKAKFDEASNAIKSYINDSLIPEIETQKATKEEIIGITLGQIPDGTITEEKLSAALNSKIAGKAEDSNLTAHTTDDEIHVTSEDKGAWSGKQDATNGLTEAALSDTDAIPFYDASAAAHRKSTWSNIKAKLKAYFDALYTLVLLGGSNRNLLDNWDFCNPVNQRGQTSYSGSWIYTIDRWHLIGGTLTVSTNGITLAAGTNLMYRIEPTMYASMVGKTYTITVYDGATYYSATVVAGTTGAVPIANGLKLQLYADAANNIYGVYLINGENSISVTLRSAKLELGSVSTLANDPSADFGEASRKCKRFFCLWTTEAARTEALKEVGLMRTTPALSTIAIGGTTYFAASAEL